MAGSRRAGYCEEKKKEGQLKCDYDAWPGLQNLCLSLTRNLRETATDRIACLSANMTRLNSRT